ncbi:MAG: NAD(P)H-dependent glycerol-3-phosphate dehydrogenase [Eggerthellaceae bacterium]
MGKIAVVGAGSWGTALAQTLASTGNEVCMWARKDEVANSITTAHRNPRYLSGIVLADGIYATSDLQECVADAESIVMVTPSRLTRSFAEQLSSWVPDTTPIVLCSKGVEEGTGMVPIQVFEEVLGGIDRLAALSGPNHAEEVVLGLPAGTVIASANSDIACYFRDLLTTSTFRCYTSSDYIGVELCAAFKNVIAIAVGASYGVGYGDNTAAMLMTRGMAEMSRLVTACGGDALTVMGLAGAGDLIATCTSEHSRNRTFGKALAQGGTLEGYEQRTHMVVEGALACKTICPLAERYNVELPITEAVRAIVWENGSLEMMAAELFNRPLTTEFWGLAAQ